MKKQHGKKKAVKKYNPPVSLPLDFETAVEGLLAVKPDRPQPAKRKKKGRKKKDVPTEPESVQKRVLTLLAEAGDAGYPLDDLSDLLGIVSPKLEPYLDVLKELLLPL